MNDFNEEKLSEFKKKFPISADLPFEEQEALFNFLRSALQEYQEKLRGEIEEMKNPMHGTKSIAYNKALESVLVLLSNQFNEQRYNLSSGLIKEFVDWFHSRGEFYAKLPVKFYTDGEPYFSSQDAECSLTDYLEYRKLLLTVK